MASMDDLQVGRDEVPTDASAWARIWFLALARFHGAREPETWVFSEAEVVAFLRSKLRAGMPAWKRLKIVEGLMLYARQFPRVTRADLSPIRLTLMELATREGLIAEEILIEEVVGRINPNEPDVIQALRRQLRLEGKAYATEKAYVGKVRAFMKDRDLRRLEDFTGIGSRDVEHHLTDLAVEGDVAAGTQNQAFYALLFLFEHVLKRDLGEINAVRSIKEPRLPSVLSESEVAVVLSQLSGMYGLIASLLYGAGMRISEVLRLRVKDFDFDQMLIEVHKSKGGKSRFVPLPASLAGRLREEIEQRRGLHRLDVESGEASVWLPHALDRKYPNAHREFRWQFLFASHKFSLDPRTGRRHRHHIHADTFPKHLRLAVKRAGIDKHVTSHTFRHSFATHLLRGGADIRTIQELLGHADLKTTMIYTHALVRDDLDVVSPLDRLHARGDSAGVPVSLAPVSNAGVPVVRPVSDEARAETVELLPSQSVAVPQPRFGMVAALRLLLGLLLGLLGSPLSFWGRRWRGSDRTGDASGGGDLNAGGRSGGSLELQRE